ncbi:Rne/Rng family ribonuclease [Gluconacetobacter tumulisoli]|uniref:Ribonuclease E n=1 Tax=Gluconacetobacter tumulisoli TaxID=1286189 RepID=A0A7W4K6X5_9PROT|nr:ribonuclease E/G [Gluconacetobacter tumulisoli]MBB2201408.1 Rne/Rng family ribonuclease [Gluconacetobacter tumulisoli]
MNKRMLIDTTHAEETRVVVMDGNRLEDYDVEASAKKQLKGNIYLAKVIRVEPSLQAAFVEYGGNRHGFLAFSEIHPDYYQIPVADREKLLALQEEEARAEEAAPQDEEADPAPRDAEGANGEDEATDSDGEPLPETVGGETDTGDEGVVQRRIARFLRSYKIQEVIRRRQILLVQVVKEERGNKGAALTTYVSLAGRYCVLMPNSLRGGGVSRKITSVADRRRLKDVIAELQIPRGMAMIVRTAGAQRPRPEIMRDCEYLLRLWDDIRDHTLNSIAPALIYEEASLIKRAIRDIYTRDVGEILVDGEAGWKSAREFMRMLMPQGAQKVKCWRDGQPLFSHFNVEGLLDSMLSPTVQLRSGGYLVINQAEALVAIDVNSGRATRERNIEETALRTNLEAAEEVARQLRLRDLAGLIVIDFIDMESRKHNAMVERRLKDALRTDRARIQVGNISHFGLLEMSRQRLRPSITESTFTPCPHCQGTGIIRGTESAALHVLRAVEEEGTRRRAAEITVHVASEIALYILNNKRVWLDEIEKRHKMRVVFTPDSTLLPPQLRIERVRPQTEKFEPVTHPALDAPLEEVETVAVPALVREIPIQDEAPARAEAETAAPPTAAEESDDGTDHRRRRRRRRRRRGGAEHGETTVQQPAAIGAPEEPDVAEAEEEESPAAAPEVVAKVPVAREEGGRERNRRRRDRHDRRPVTPELEAPYRGPTPANPFGNGIIDIFDVIEQSTDTDMIPSAPAKAPVSDEIIDIAETLAISEPEAVPEEKVVEAVAEIVTDADTVEAEVPAAPVEVEIEAEPAPKRTPRRRATARPRKAAAKVETEAPAPVVAATPEADAEIVVAEPAKPARRRATTRKAAAKSTVKTPSKIADEPVAATEVESETPVAEAPVTEAEEPKKPTRKRAPRATATRKAKSAEPAAIAVTEDASPAAEAPAAETVEAPAKPRRTRKAPARAKKAEPLAEAPMAAAAPTTEGPGVQPIVIDDSAPAPVRKTGWWRR